MFFLSVIPKIALFAILVKIYTLLGLGCNPELSLYFIVSGALSVIIGSVGGLYQKRIKRLLAYSMITNTGYLVILLGVSTYFAVSAIFFFLFIYIITLIGTFSVVLSNRVEPYKLTVKNLYGLANGFYINSTKAVLFGILLFSSAGLPPFAGFIAKFLAILPLSSSGVVLSSVIVVILFITALSVFYYIRIIKVMSFYRRKFWLFFSPVGGYSATIIALSCVLLVIFFVCAGFLVNLGYNAIITG
jgi:NADH:ubiquinone oxidoreductase subunit 2 (subunit N)